MDRDEVDRALARLREEKERITAGLLALENHQGYQFLDGTPLTGATKRCWQDLQAKTITMWTLLDAYTRVLAQAEELRAKKSKPGQFELAELTRLLTGLSVELTAGDVPLEERTLRGPTGEYLTLDGVVERMTPLYEEAAKTTAAVDDTWSALLTRLAEVEDTARSVEALLTSLGGGEPELDRLSRELAEVRDVVRTDPLALAPGDPRSPDGRADTSRLDSVAAGLGALRSRLEDARRIQVEHDARVRRIGETIEQLETAEAEARSARDLVIAKITTAALPELPDLASALRDRLAALATLRGQGRWIELAARVGELEIAAESSLALARTSVGTITGLLDRRDELRGRLEAYRAKAGRLGRAEDAELGRLYRRAHDLLWTSPCDLRQATRALAGYQRAIGGTDDD